jgi:hypothetical protein
MTCRLFSSELLEMLLGFAVPFARLDTEVLGFAVPFVRLHHTQVLGFAVLFAMLHIRYESRKKPESFYILGYLLDLIIKIWPSSPQKNFEIWQIWVTIPWKILYISQNYIFR